MPTGCLLMNVQLGNAIGEKSKAKNIRRSRASSTCSRTARQPPRLPDNCAGNRPQRRCAVCGRPDHHRQERGADWRAKRDPQTHGGAGHRRNRRRPARVDPSVISSRDRINTDRYFTLDINTGRYILRADDLEPRQSLQNRHRTQLPSGQSLAGPVRPSDRRPSDCRAPRHRASHLERDTWNVSLISL